MTITITNVSFVKITAAYIVPFYNPHISMKKMQVVTGDVQIHQATFESIFDSIS